MAYEYNVVRSLSSSNTGAPVLTGTVGSLVALMRGVLGLGYNSKSVTSITVLGTVMTIQCADAGTFEGAQTIRIEGAAESPFNNYFKIKTKTATTITCTVPVGFPISATGTITMRIAGLDWEELFAGTADLAMFRSNDLTSTRVILKVLDQKSIRSPTYNSGVVGSEYMSGAFQSVLSATSLTVHTGGSLEAPIIKSDTNTVGTPIPWEVIGDGKRFYLFIDWKWLNVSYIPYFAGDILSSRVGDAYGFMVSGSPNDGSQLTSGGTALSSRSNSWVSNGYFFSRLGRLYGLRALVSAESAMSLAKGYNQLDGSSKCWLVGLNSDDAATYSASTYRQSTLLAFPNAGDSAIYTIGAYVMELLNGTYSIRGSMPGYLYPVHNMASNGTRVYPISRLKVNGGLRDGRVLTIHDMDNLTGVGSRVIIDTTGPWE